MSKLADRLEKRFGFSLARTGVLSDTHDYGAQVAFGIGQVFLTDHRRDRTEMMHRRGFDCPLQAPIELTPVGPRTLALWDVHIANFGRRSIVDRVCGCLLYTSDAADESSSV